MRFRVKLNGHTAKVEVPGSSCTWGELREAITTQLFPANPSKVLEELQLSFNNKDAIAGEDGADVKSLGIAGGDLLWVLSPKAAPDPPRPASQAKRAKEGVSSAQGGAGAAAAAAGPSGTQPVQAETAPMEEDPAQEQGQAEAWPSAGAEEEPHAAQAVPSYLLRTLAASAAATPAQVLLLAAHAAMLETGFQPTWVPAGTEGAGAGEGATAGAVSPYAVPPFCQVSATIFRLRYRLPVLGGASSEGGARPSGANAGEADNSEGDGGGSGEVCMLQCSTMGPSAAVLVASTPRGHTHHLPLLASSFMEVSRPGPNGGQHGQSGATSAQRQTSNEAGLSTCLAAKPDAGGGQGVEILDGRWRLAGEGARRLWRALKDGLAFPMLLAAYADAGLPAPAGLLALPEELKLAVLGQLNALQLAALSATCTELRHLASQDDLWRPLFATEFPSASAFVTSQAQRRGYKWAFGACWRDRRQREEAARRQRRFMPAIPHMGPRPPFYPPPGPLGMPGITGGDYDRLPQPFLGGGPGMYPGGGGLGALMFGTGRRQGRGSAFRML